MSDEKALNTIRSSQPPYAQMTVQLHLISHLSLVFHWVEQFTSNNISKWEYYNIMHILYIDGLNNKCIVLLSTSFNFRFVMIYKYLGHISCYGHSCDKFNSLLCIMA